MIRTTLAQTKLATYAIELPSPQMRGMPAPMGTGFFVSADGWFVTAAHVIAENNQLNGPVRKDLDQAWLMKESGLDDAGGLIGGMCQFVRFEEVDAATDFALLKVDFRSNATKRQLVGLTGFPFLQVSSRTLDEGEQVYSFGYPLAEPELLLDSPEFIASHSGLAPRVTSAIVAAKMDRTQLVSVEGGPMVYVLDKALNYGNSGGPIVSTETGCVHALCSRFQPVCVPQPHLRDGQGRMLTIAIPSLYGVVSRLSNTRILELLSARGVPISDS
jgi:serine protease Do